MIDPRLQFAKFIQILGKGKKGSRSLTQPEAYVAMSLILEKKIEPLQLGAFLMLLRIKEESPEELAGFIQAARQTISTPSCSSIQLDWPTYAGKRRQLPWYLLSALLLAQNGVQILMHGTTGVKDQRIYPEDALKSLGINASASLNEASTDIKNRGFAFIRLEDFHPVLKEIINYRELFGLRSPINTLVRSLNPMNAAHSLLGTFHPGYREIHQKACTLNNQAHIAVIKGEGGEAERNPDDCCEVFYSHHGIMSTEEWPAFFSRRHLKDSTMDPSRLAQVWQGDINHEYGIAATIGTTAIVLRLLDKASTPELAIQQANLMWQQRQPLNDLQSPKE
ncbi:MAG TPA: glycosyl transferase family protein [Gammaproteobacteria bacterium]|nr:glycosyl transferase family protein [Gammaproteobacteria bacterium]